MINTDFIGRLGGDSEIRTTESGKKFLSLRVATDDFNKGEKTTTWINVMWSGDRAIKMQEYLKKGSHVSIRGVLRASIYKTRNGEDMISYDVFADRIDFVSSGSSKTNESESAGTNEFGTLKKQEAPAAETPALEPASTAINDDDLPF